MEDAGVTTSDCRPACRSCASQTYFDKLHATTQTHLFLVDTCTQTDEEDSVWLDDKSDSLNYQASPHLDISFNLDCIQPESVSTMYDSDSNDYGDEEDLTDVHTGKAKVCLAYTECIRKLFSFCLSWGSPILTSIIWFCFKGTMLNISLECLNGCCYEWNSQPQPAALLHK